MAKRTVWVTIVSICFSSLGSGGVIDNDAIMARGDANGNGSVDLSDALYITEYLFSGGPAPPCMNQADANNSGTVDQSDTIYLLNWLFDGGAAPPYPGPYNATCTYDDEPFPGCETSC